MRLIWRGRTANCAICARARLWRWAMAFPYAAIAGLSREMVERLSAARPATLAAAGRVAGITPAALAALLVHARRRAA